MVGSENLALLERARVGRLGMIDTRGKPYTIPLRFVWVGGAEGAVYFRLQHEGRKGEALEKSQRVCFETDECKDDFSHYASVVIEGTIEAVEEEKEKRDALVAFNAKYTRLCGLPNPGPNPVTKGVCIRKLKVEAITGRKREVDEVEQAVVKGEVKGMVKGVKTVKGAKKYRSDFLRNRSGVFGCAKKS